MNGAGAREPKMAWGAVMGLHRGVLGGLAMVGWFLLASSLLRQPTWTVPNLLATLVNQEVVLRRGFGWGSVVGVALAICGAGVVGAAFGVVTAPLRSRRRLLLLGLVTGVLTYWATNALVFRRLGAVAWVYVSPRTLLVAHLLMGAVLGWRGREAGESVPSRVEVSPDRDEADRFG